MWATSTKTIAMMLIVYYDTDMEEEDTKGIEAHNKCKRTDVTDLKSKCYIELRTNSYKCHFYQTHAQSLPPLTSSMTDWLTSVVEIFFDMTLAFEVTN